MKQFSDDELDELPVASSKKPTTQPTAVAPSTATASTEELELDEDEVPAKSNNAKASSVEDEEVFESVEFGDQKLISRSDGLDRIRPDKDKVARFALLPFLKDKKGVPLALRGNSHFVDTKDKKGTFRCVPGETPYCCQKLDQEGMTHVVALALHYVNANPKDGTYAKGTPIEWEIGYVDLSRSNFRSVSGLAPEDSSVYDIDIVMSKKISGIGYEFVAKATKAKWKQNPELAEEVEAAAQKFVKDGGKRLNSKLGRKLTLVEWKSLLSGLQAASGKEASLEDVDDL